MSPFSTLCDYSISQVYSQKRGNMHLSLRDQILIFRVQLAGAAALFQICDKRKDKTKLKTLCRAGILNLYRLEGAFRMNVVSWEDMNLNQLLRAMVLAQYLLISGASFDGRQVYIDRQPYDLFIFRYGDPIVLNEINCCSNVLIIAEEYHVEFDAIRVPVRIVLDQDLIVNCLRYYGTKTNLRQQ